MGNYQKILIIQTAFIGDVILTTPLIRETKKLFPEAEISVIVIPETASVLANNPHISQLVTFDKRKNRVTSFFELLKLIRENGFDLALLPHNSFTTAFLVFLAGVRERYSITVKPWGNILAKRVSTVDCKLKIERMNCLLRPFIREKLAIETELFPSEADYQTADLILKQLDPDKQPIAVAPGSVWKSKCWPHDYYAELIFKLQEKASFVFIGSQDEKNLCAEIIKSSGAKGYNAAGETSLLQSVALIKKCKLILCNDSGAMHLANAVDTKVVTFFGPTVKKFGFYPYRQDDVVFEVSLKCRPCGKHGHQKCPLEHHNCMQQIKPDEVYQKIEKLLD